MTIIRMNQDYDKLILDAQEKNVKTLTFSMSDVMQNGHGRFVSPASFGVIEKFMSGKRDNGANIDFSKFTQGKSGNIELTHTDIISLIYTEEKLRKQAETGERALKTTI